MAKLEKGEPPIDEFSKSLTAEDELGSVLRAHLIIEFHVDELLEVLAPSPSALARMELDYFGKVRLLGVLGIPDGLVKPLSNIGNLRNSFAHRLNYSLTNERMKALFDCLDSDGKQFIHMAYERTRKRPPHDQIDYPNSIWDLRPKDQFSILASGVRALLRSSLGRTKEARGSAAE